MLPLRVLHITFQYIYVCIYIIYYKMQQWTIFKLFARYLMFWLSFTQCRYRFIFFYFAYYIAAIGEWGEYVYVCVCVCARILIHSSKASSLRLRPIAIIVWQFYALNICKLWTSKKKRSKKWKLQFYYFIFCLLLINSVKWFSNIDFSLLVSCLYLYIYIYWCYFVYVTNFWNGN